MEMAMENYAPLALSREIDYEFRIGRMAQNYERTLLQGE